MSGTRTDFPGGSGTDFEWLAPDRLRFVAPTGDSPYSMWFHFVVDAPECDLLHCALTQVQTALGWPYQAHVRPVYRRAGGEWERASGIGVDIVESAFRFDVECARQTTEVAFCYPYQVADWERFLVARLSPLGARQVEIGRSEGGRPLIACEVGEGETTVLLCARAHSGETPGSFVLEGALDELVGTDGLRICAIPFVDIDGVVTGLYGKGRAPVDFYDAWQEDDTRPEVSAYKRYIAALPSPPRVAIDLHAPTPSDPSYIECSVVAGADQAFSDGVARLVGLCIAESASQPETALAAERVGSSPGWYPRGFERCMPGYLQREYGTVAITLESAYHATHEGVVVGSEAWMAQGRAVARAVRRVIGA
jgi:hypothetical protein